MPASITIKEERGTLIEERGTFSARLHRHNGYYAGDFSAGPRASESGIRMRRHTRTSKLVVGASMTNR